MINMELYKSKIKAGEEDDDEFDGDETRPPLPIPGPFPIWPKPLSKVNSHSPSLIKKNTQSLFSVRRK